MGINQEQHFYCNNGEVLKNIEELRRELEKNINSVNLENFYHHVNEERNDYATWLKVVFREHDLSNLIRQKKSPAETLEVLNNYFEELEKKKEPKKSEQKEKGLKSFFKNIFEKKNKKEPQKEELPEQQKKESAEEKNEPKKEESSSVKEQKYEIIKSYETTSLSDRSKKLLEKTKLLRKKSYLDAEKQKESVRELTERYEELYTLISDHRKQGKEMLIPYMKLRLTKPKIHLLEVDNNFEERKRIKELLEEVQEEIEEELQIKKVDIKKEVLEKAGVKKEEEE